MSSWVGCFEYDRSDLGHFYEHFYEGIYESFSTSGCSERCRGHDLVAMHDEGLCMCMRTQPEPPSFQLVADLRCGHVCRGEAHMLPERFCGTSETFAVYRIRQAPIGSAAAPSPAVGALPEASATSRPSTGTTATSTGTSATSATAAATTTTTTTIARKPRAGARPASSSAHGKGEKSAGDGRAGARVAPRAASKPPPKNGGTPKAPLKSICYAPVPSKGSSTPFDNDDFMSPNTSALWGPQGRHDLRIIKKLGANAVRLYGNDLSVDHRSFLEEAHRLGLSVIAGISDYPYVQMEGSCIASKMNCYQQIKDAYASNLRNGFLLPNKSYHPALSTVVVMNEPDLKFVPVMQPKVFCRGMISALDAVVDAEKEAGVVGPRPNLTVTFSFGVCEACSRFRNHPAVAQMDELRRAMHKPQLVSYSPKNNLSVVYESRFTNSFNTANPVADLKRMFLDTYDEHFRGVPVFLGEYHSPHVADQAADLEGALQVAADPSTMLMGLSFFEFQVRYDKGGSEMDFGMFELGREAISKVDVGSGSYTAWCLEPQRGKAGQAPLPAAVAKAFGGRLPTHAEAAGMCRGRAGGSHAGAAR